MPGDQLDDEMRTRIMDLGTRMRANPEDLPVLGEIRGDATPFCVNDSDGWHITSRERDRILSDRSSTDPDKYLSLVAEVIAERIAWRLHPPESGDFPRAAWQAQYDALACADQSWAETWLATLRARMIDAGADEGIIDSLPSP